MTYESLADREAAAHARAARNGHSPPDDQEPLEPTGWERVDLTPWLDGTPPDDSPKIGARTDGQAILYPGKIHSFNGEPEAGKSLCAQHLSVQHIAAGDNILYLDFEDGPAAVTARLIAFGASIDHIRDRFHYHQITNSWSVEALLVVEAALVATSYTLAVLDGITEAMMLCGLSPRDESEVARFWNMLPRRLARTGAAALLIDHVVKDTDQRGRWAIGSEHKMAGIDGAAFTIEAATPFGRNKTGSARLIITKDRPAWLRQHAAHGKTIAEFHVKSEGDHMQAELRPADDGGDSGFQPTGTMERISHQLAHGPALTSTELRGAIKGKPQVFALALRLLVADGYVRALRTGHAIYHSNIRPYPDPVGDPEQEPDESF